MQVFLSYADSDREFAEQLARSLRDRGYEVWFDAAVLVPGEDWHHGVNAGLENSDAMVALMSKASTDSRGMQSEVDYALGSPAYRNRLVPVLVGDATPEAMPWVLRTFQYVNLETIEPKAIEDATRRIDEALSSAADEASVHASG